MQERVRRCPNDGESLEKVPAAGIEIDACRTCKGVWLDRGEIESLAKGFHGADLRAFRGAGSFATGPRECPACGRKLLPLRYGAGPRSVIIDRCIDCGGLWLDRGELGAVSRQAQKVEEIARRPIHARPPATPAIEREEEWSAPVIVSALTGIPVEVDNPIRHTPIVTWSLIAINVAVFILQLASGNPQRFIETWGMSPRRVLEGEGLITVFTSMFIHANFLHILGNMIFLYIFGDNVEDRLRSFAFAFLYIIFGLAANAVDLLLFPTRSEVGVGASGAISGVLGCYLVFFPRSQLVTVICLVPIRVAAWVYLGIWILFQVIGASGQGPGGGINYIAHVAGFATGLATGFAVGLILRALEGPEETRPAGARIR